MHIFFDLDHTLWDFDANSHLTLEELHQEFLTNLHFSFEEFMPIFREINHGLWQKWAENNITQEALRVERFQFTLEHFGIHNLPLAQTLSEEYLKRCPYKPGLMPNAIEVLDYLKPKYDLHLITNGFLDAAEIKLNVTPLGSYFKEVIVSEVVGVQKPHPDIYSHALERARATAENSIMIGDNLYADVIGAQNAGWKAIFYNPFKKPHEATPDWEISDLRELMQIL